MGGSSNGFWAGRRVLVTGGAGFVGSNLCRALVNQGAIVYGYDLRRGPSWDVLELPKDRLIIGSVRDPLLVHCELSACGIEVVFHLAGMGHIKACAEHPLSAWQNNVEGTWAVLEACRMMGEQVKAVVVASSNHIYGAGEGMNEWAAFDQSDVYGTSKACADLISRAYGGLGVRTAALRHVNCFGPADPHSSHLVTGAICDLLEQKAPLIHSDGTPRKGYLHVEDVISAYLLLGQRLVEGTIPMGQGWNAAPLEPISVADLVNLVIEVSGRSSAAVVLKEDLSQSGYLEHLRSLRLRNLGWVSTPLNLGLRATWNWYEAKGGMAWAAS